MANPEFYLFDAREQYRGRLVPVYRSTRGLSQTMLRRHIEKALEALRPRQSTSRCPTTCAHATS